MNREELKAQFKMMLNSDDINDHSLYPNANKGGDFRSVETLVQEIFSEQQEQLGMAMLEEFLPKESKDYLLGLLSSGDLYLHDRTKILVPYCISLDLSRLLSETTNYGRLKTTPVKRIDSYISAVADSVSQFCFYVAGAIGLGTFFIDIGRLMRDNHQWTVQEVKQIASIRKYIENEYQQLIHSLNFYARGTESAFTNLSVFDEDILKIIDNVDDDLIPYIIEAQNIFLDFFNQGDPSTDGLPYTFPIVTINSSNPNTPFMQKVSELDFCRFNFFLNKEAKFALCCRLSSNIELMRDLASHANSFGASPATIGSHRVVTINFNSLALQARTLEDYLTLVYDRCLASTKILRAHKDLIIYLHKQGIQPLIKEGWINLHKLFSTIGIIGIVEAQETLSRRFNTNVDYIQKTLDLLNSIVYKFSSKFNLAINIEQIPGEAARFNLCAKDKARFGEEQVPYTFYANQFCPLTKEVDLFEKIDIEGKYYETLTGGGIAHLRCPDRPTPNQFIKILEYALSKGCGHIAFSAVYSICEQGHVTIGKHKKCEVCNGDVLDYIERIVGYLQRVSSWGVNARNIDFKARKFVTSKVN